MIIFIVDLGWWCDIDGVFSLLFSAATTGWLAALLLTAVAAAALPYLMATALPYLMASALPYLMASALPCLTAALPCLTAALPHLMGEGARQTLRFS